MDFDRVSVPFVNICVANRNQIKSFLIKVHSKRLPKSESVRMNAVDRVISVQMQ